MIDEIRISQALMLLEKTAQLCCKQPEKCALIWKAGSINGHISFEVGNADDAMRLTGKKGQGLDLFAKLAKILMSDAGITPLIKEIVNTDKSDEFTFKPYEPNPNWPREKVKALLQELSEAAFIQTEISVTCEDNRDSTDFIILFPKVTDAEIKFVKIVDKISGVWGGQIGRRLVVDCVSNEELIAP